MGAQPRFYSTFSTSSTVQLLICIISEHWLLPADSMSVMLCSFGSLFEPFQRILPSHLAGGGQFCWVCHRVCLFCGWISMLNFGDSKWADFWHSANQQHQLIEIMETFWAEVAILFSNPLNSTQPVLRESYTILLGQFSYRRLWVLHAFLPLLFWHRCPKFLGLTFPWQFLSFRTWKGQVSGGPHLQIITSAIYTRWFQPIWKISSFSISLQ